MVSAFTVSHHPPAWIEENNNVKQWDKINLISLISGILVFGFSFIFIEFNLYNVFLFSGIGILLYVFLLSAYTDFKFRYVDRRILNIFQLTALFLGATVVSSFGEEDLVLYIFLVLISLSTVFLPIFGASDGRMLTLGTILIYPAGGIFAYVIFIIATMMVTIFYVIVSPSKNTSKKKKLFSKFVQKTSIPAVPFLAAAAIGTMLASYIDSLV